MKELRDRRTERRVDDGKIITCTYVTTTLQDEVPAQGAPMPTDQPDPITGAYCLGELSRQQPQGKQPEVTVQYRLDTLWS